MEDMSEKEKTVSENPGKTSETPKRLYRSGKDKMLAGVCGGIAEYFNVDPTLIRLLWVGFTLLTFVPLAAGIIFYIIAWVIIPRNPYHKWEN